MMLTESLSQSTDSLSLINITHYVFWLNPHHNQLNTKQPDQQSTRISKWINYLLNQRMSGSWFLRIRLKMDKFTDYLNIISITKSTDNPMYLHVKFSLFPVVFISSISRLHRWLNIHFPDLEQNFKMFRVRELKIKN